MILKKTKRLIIWNDRSIWKKKTKNYPVHVRILINSTCIGSNKLLAFVSCLINGLTSNKGLAKNSFISSLI